MTVAQRRPMRVLVVMGEGGHSKECLRLVDLMGEEAYRYAYILVADDHVTAAKIRVPGPIYRIVRPSCGKTNTNRLMHALKFPLSALQAAVALRRVRPDLVLTTGPAVAVSVCVAAKLMGIDIVFVETGSRIHRLSTTGRFMRWIADLYFVQWQELLPAVPRAVFAGRLF
jgi:beta-1,4-N-acetylglucosaminyltransferase